MEVPIGGLTGLLYIKLVFKDYVSSQGQGTGVL